MIEPNLAVVIRSDLIAPRVRRIEFRPGARTSPIPQPGAHITVQSKSGLARSYSITEVTAEGHYVICVLRDDGGRGGSISMHDLKAGDSIQVGTPRNAFALVPADSYLFIAGGIGITPIRSMYASVRDRADARMLYLTRNAEDTVFTEELAGDPSAIIHHSASSGRFDLWSILGVPDEITHMYCCGPHSLMDEVRRLTMHWRPSHIHFENFAGIPATTESSKPFTVRWQPDGRRIFVPAHVSLLDALRTNGISVASSCGSGTCGTCVLDLVAGTADHRDLVLTNHERGAQIMPCVSRASSSEIVVRPKSVAELHTVRPLGADA